MPRPSEEQQIDNEAFIIVEAIIKLIATMKNGDLKRVVSQSSLRFDIRRNAAMNMVLRASPVGYTGKVRIKVVKRLRSMEYTVLPLTQWPRTWKKDQKHAKKSGNSRRKS